MFSNVLAKFKAMNKLSKLTTLLVLSINIIALAFLVIYFGTIFVQTAVFHIPIEYRDMSPFSIAQAFSQWKNPYSVEYFQSVKSPLAYQYTFVVSIIIAMIHNATAIDFVTAALIMNYSCIFIAVFFIYQLLKELCNINRLYIVPIIYFTICGFSMFVDQAPGLTARGDAIGIALLSIIYWLIAKHKDKVVLISFLSAMLFYTRSTDVVMALPVFIFYLIDNWKKAVKYFLCCIGFGAASILIVRLAFPLFFVQNVYYCLGGVLDRGDISTAKENYEFFYNSNIVISSLYRIGIAALVIKFAISIFNDGFKKFWSKYGVIAMMLFAALIYPVVLNLFKASYVILDGYKYCNSLLFEPVMIVALYFIFTLIEAAPQWFLPDMKNDDNEVKKCVVTIIGAVLAASVCLASFVKYVWKVPSLENIREWQHAYNLISEYDIEKIYLGPMISTYLLYQEGGIEVAYYDNGQAEFTGSENANMQLSRMAEFKDFYLFNTVDYEDEKFRVYGEDISNMIDEGYYDLIIIPRFGTVFIDIEDLEENYEKIEEIHLASFINECYYGVYVRR